MAFVSYDSYKNRIEKLARFKNFVVKYKFLIMGVLAVILGGAIALMVTKGMITSDLSLTSNTFTYGDSYSPAEASAFLSNVGYEYALQGTDDWTCEKPRKVGKYSVRAVSDKLIGKGYGKAFDFEILPKQVEFAFGDEASLRYGDKPENYSISDLVAGDRIDKNGAAFTYAYHDEADNVSEWTVDVTVAAGGVKIVDNNGNDFSDCYVYETAGKTFALERRTISVALQSSSETYRGAEIFYKGELKTCDLAEGDSIAFETEITQNGAPATLLNAGAYGISVKDGSVKISDASGAEVTKRYDYGTPVNGTFTVNKKTLSITTHGGSKVYDGTALSSEGGTPDGLISGHKLSPVDTAPSITDVGTVLNAQTFDILDANGNLVSANYDYINNYNYGYLTVTRRPLNITTEGGEWEYDGTAHPVKNHTVSGLANGQQLANISYSSENAIDVDDSGKNTLSYGIVWGESGAEVDINNYNITEIYGDIRITARPLKVTTDGDSRPYDGTPLSVGTYTVSYAGTQTGGGALGAFIKPGEDLSIVGSLPRIINVGTKENAINFKAPNNNYYVKETVNGTLKITQAEITVTIDNASCDYGDALPAPDITISGSGIVGGKLFGGDTFKPAFRYLKDGAVPASYEAGKTYEISLDTASSTFTYGNSEPVSEPNYKITSNISTLSVGSRAITVTLNDITLNYGDAVSYTSGGETVVGVVEGQTVQVTASQVVFDITSTMPDAGTYYGAISCPATAITILSGATPVTSNYTITVKVSALYINQREITVKAKDMLGVIYGEEISYEVKEGNYANTPDLATGEKLTINNVIYGYNQGETPIVGTYTIKPDVNQITVLKSDGTTSSRSNYKIIPENGTLEIVKRPVRIESGTNRDLIYDGTAQYDKSFEVLLDNPQYYDVLSVHEIVVTNYTTVTDVTAAVQNRHSYDIVDQSGTSVIDNYAVYTSSGYLIVSPRPITVKLLSYSATYGDDYSYEAGAGNYENTPDLAAGETLEITSVKFGFTGSRPTVGKYPITLPVSCKILKADGKDGSDGNYTVTFENGELEITKRDITVQLISYLAEYGESYAYKTGAGNYVKNPAPDLVGTDKLEITAVTYEFGSVQYPEVNDGGYSVSQADYTITTNGADGKGNYEVDWQDGTLTITKRTITVTLNDIASVDYGETVAYIKGGETVENTIGVCTVDFDTSNLKFTPAQTGATYTYPDAGAYKVDCDGTDITVLKDGDDVTHNYTVTIVSGNLKITKRKIKVKASDYEREYGENFNYSTVTPNYEKLTSGSLAVFDGKEETLYIFVNSLEFDGLVKRNVGTYPVHPDSYVVTKVDGTTDSSNNYEVEFEDGTLTISKKALNIELPSFSTPYGSDEYEGKTYAELYAEEIEVEELPFGELLQFTVGFTSGGKTVLPKEVALYGVEVTQEEILHSDGSVTENGNYAITYTGSQRLQIQNRQIQILPRSVTAVYGDEIIYPSGTSNFTYATVGNNPIKFNMPVYGDELEITVKYALDDMTPPSVGKYNVIPDTLTVHYKDGTSKTVTLNSENDGYYFFEVGGYWIMCRKADFAEKLEITHREIKVTLNDIPDAVYGDEIKYKNGGETADNLVEGHTLAVDPDGIDFEAKNGAVYPNVGEYTIKATNENFIKIFSGEAEVTSNYKVTEVINSTLTINARKITLKLTEVENVVYGNKLPEPEIISDDLVYGDKIIASSYTYKTSDDTAVTRYSVGNYKVYLDGYTFTDKNGKAYAVENYDVVGAIYPAEFEIIQRNITVTLKDFDDLVYGDIDDNGISWGLNYSLLKGELEEYLEIGGEGVAPGEHVDDVRWGQPNEFGTHDRLRSAGTYNLSIFFFVIRCADNTIDIVKDNDKDCITNYALTIEGTATLTINPKPLTVKLGEMTVPYGTKAPLEEFYVDGLTTGLAFNESLSCSKFFPEKDGVKVEDDYPDAGTYKINANPEDVVIKYSPVAGGTSFVRTDGYKNYNITFEGTLTVTAQKLTVTLKDIEAVYTSTDIDYKHGGFTAEGLLETLGHSLALDPDGISITAKDGAIYPNAGEYSITCDNDFIKILSGSDEVTKNYEVTVEDGTLTINARKITLTMQPVDNVVYGEDLPEPEALIESADGSAEGLVNGDTFKLSVVCAYPDYILPNRLDVGEYILIYVPQYSVFTYANGAPTTVKNYEIVNEVNPVGFEITQRPITITLHDIEREYGVLSSGTLQRLHWVEGLPDSSTRVGGNTEQIIEIGGEYGFVGDSVYQIVWDVVDKDTGECTSYKNANEYILSPCAIYIRNSDGEMHRIFLQAFISGQILNEGNYEITEINDATLTINPKEVTLDIGDIEVTYGDKDYLIEDYTYMSEKGLLPFGEQIYLSYIQLVGYQDYPYHLGEDYRLGVGTYKVDPDYNRNDYGVYDENGEEIDISDLEILNYNVTVNGQLVVKARPITVSLKSLSSVRYGSTLSYPTDAGNYLNSPDLAYNEQLEVAVIWSFNGENIEVPKNVGKYGYEFDKDNSIIYDENGNVISGGMENYSVTCTDKTARITLFTFRETFADTEIYYGDELEEKSGVFYYDEYVGEGSLPYNETLEVARKYVKVEGGEEVGEVENPTEAGTYLIKYMAHRARNEDGTLSEYVNYSMTQEDVGTLTIKPRPITVNATDLPDVVYGDPVIYTVEQGNHGAIGGMGLVEGHTLAITSVVYYDKDGKLIEGAPTEAGTYYILPTAARIYYADGNSVDMNNYAVTYPAIPEELSTLGTVKIVPKQILLVTNTRDDLIYNGDFQFDTGYTLWLLDEEGNKLKTLDLTDEEMDSVILGDYTKVKDVCTEVDNIVELTFPNYDIAETEWGKLTVSQREITVTTPDFEGIYNGNTYLSGGSTIANKIEGHKYFLNIVNKLIYVGSTQNKVEITDILDKNDVSVIDNYNIKYEYGTLTVLPRPIVVVRGSATKPYDGTALTCTDYVSTYYKDEEGNILDGLLNGDTVHAVEGKITELYRATTIDNKTEFEPDTKNYEIVGYEGGTLTVTARPITIKIDSLTVDYGNTNPIGADGFTYADGSEEIVSGEVLSLAVRYYDKTDAAKTLLTSVKNVGTYGVVLDEDKCYVTTSYDGENGFSNYRVSFVEGEVTVNPKEITVTLEDLTKVYGEDFEGYPERVGNYASVEDGLATGDTLQVFVKYSEDITERTPVGSYTISADYCAVNGFNYYFDEDESVMDCGNYKITFVDSTLTVTRRPIKIVTATAEKEGYYDGTYLYSPEKQADYTVKAYYKNALSGTPDGIAPWDSADKVLELVSTSVKSIINAGTIYNEVEYSLLSDNYKLLTDEFVYGTLTIKQRPITIQLKQIGNQTYGTRLSYPDGSAAPNFDYADGSLQVVSGEKLVIAVVFFDEGGNAADPKNAGDYSYVMNKGGSTVTNSIGGAGINNYAITCDDTKYVKVNKLHVVLSLNAWDSVDYDGNFHEYDGGITNVFPYGETMELAVDYYSVKDGVETLIAALPKNAGGYAVKYNEANSRIGGVAPDVNYVIDMENGEGIPFTIRAKDITISMDTETRTYDGEVYDYLTYNENLSISGVVSGETVIPSVSYYSDEELTVSATPQNAGTYYIAYNGTFTVTGSNNVVENYNVTNADAWCQLIISQRQVIVTVQSREIEHPTEDIDPLADESYTDVSEDGGFGFTAEDLAKLTPVYSYFYTGKDGTEAPAPVTVPEVKQTGFYKVEVSFEGASEVLDNYYIYYVNGILEITATQVEIVPEYDGKVYEYDGNPISLEGFGFKHYHKGYSPAPGFAAEDVPVYNAESGPSYKLLFALNGYESYDAPVNAGTYEVKFVFENIDGEEYRVFNDGSVSVTITPRPIKVAFEYDEDDYKNLTYNYSELPTSSVSLTVTDTTGAEQGILGCDSGLDVVWRFYNYTLGRTVEYNYAGAYVLAFALNKATDNYVIENPVSNTIFTVAPAPLYVTPLSENADYTYAGQTLSITRFRIWEEYGVLYGTDTLTVTRTSGVLKTTRSIPATIKEVQIMQGGLDVTSSYAVHFAYEEGSPVAASEFTATLSFNPVKIYYTQTVLDDEHRTFDYNGMPHDLGVDKNNLQNYVQISNGSAFVGTYRLEYVLVPIVAVREYQKWIQILVFDGDNNNVTPLYDFQLTNGEASKVVVKGYDLNLTVTLSDEDLTDAWTNRDSASDNTLTASDLYAGYYVLNSGYTVSGFTKDSHECEILVREEGGKLVLKAIVFEEGAYGRAEASITYTLNVSASLTAGVTLTRIGLIISSLTTTTPADNSASIGG